MMNTLNSVSTLVVLFLLLLLCSFFFGKNKALAMPSVINLGDIDDAKNIRHSLPRYYGYHMLFWAGFPIIVFLVLFWSFENKIIDHYLVNDFPKELLQSNIGLTLNKIKLTADELLSSGQQGIDPITLKLVNKYIDLKSITQSFKLFMMALLAILGVSYSYFQLKPTFTARNHVERYIRYLLLACSFVAVITTVGIVFSVLFESIHFFKSVSTLDFLFGLHWSPQMAIRPDQVGSSGSFGAIPLFVGTLLISFIAMCISVPVGLFSAIYLAQYANKKVRNVAKPALELLAGIPTVVYGFFAAITVAPFIREVGEKIGLNIASESALAAGVVMGIMIVPFVSSLSDDVITAVPKALSEGSLGLGATKSETIKKVIIPAALPGIVGGILLAVSRAIGETMIVVMAAGLTANLTFNPLEAVTTVTVQIVTLLTGDQEFDSPKTLAAFALALMLFFTTLILNFIALHVVKKYREQYE